MNLSKLIQVLGEVLGIMTLVILYKFDFVNMRYPDGVFNTTLMSFYLLFLIIELLLIYQYYNGKEY